MNTFSVDEKYLTSVTVAYAYTEEESDFKTMWNVDHPSFAALRNHLKSRKFIRTEQWWNGDTVLISFIFNEKLFKVGAKFPSAGAMKLHLKYKDD